MTLSKTTICYRRFGPENWRHYQDYIKQFTENHLYVNGECQRVMIKAAIF